MNKKANLYLGFNGIVSFFLFLVCIGGFLAVKELPFKIPSTVHFIIFFLGWISCFVYVSIELFLFMILTKKMKFIAIIYSLIEVTTSILINSKIVFSAFIIFTAFYMIKGILRMIFAKKIYEPKKYEHYRKMFHFFKKKKNIKKEESINKKIKKS